MAGMDHAEGICCGHHLLAEMNRQEKSRTVIAISKSSILGGANQRKIADQNIVDTEVVSV